MSYRGSVNFWAIAPAEATSFAWAGLLRDHELSLRTQWFSDCPSATAHLATQIPDLIALLGQPSTELLQHCHQHHILLVVFNNSNTHQTASWLEGGAEAVLPATHLAALVPLALRGLKRKQVLDKARTANAARQAAEQHHYHRLEQLHIRVAKVAAGQYLWAN